MGFLSWVSLKLDQSLSGYSHKLWATITPAHLVDWRDCGSKALWLGWCHSSATGFLVLLQKMLCSVSLFSITRSPHQRHPQRFQEVSHIHLKLPPNSGHGLPLHPSLTHLILPVPILPAPVHPHYLFYFPFPGRSMSLSAPSLILILSESVDFSMIVCYLTANECPL